MALSIRAIRAIRGLISRIAGVPAFLRLRLCRGPIGPSGVGGAESMPSLRLASKSHLGPSGVARAAIQTLLGRGERLIVVPQNLYEFWAVATPAGRASGVSRPTRTGCRWSPP